MLRTSLSAALALALLGACGGASPPGADGYSEAMPAPPPPPPAPVMMEMASRADMAPADMDMKIVQEDQGGGGQQQPDGQTPDPAAARLIAYTYSYGFAVPTGNMEALLNAHKASCEAAGPAVCYVVNSSISGLGEDYASGSLTMKGSAAWVATFKEGMAESLKGYDAELDASNTSAEDLTVQIIDTTARLNSAKTLRDRLQQLLAERPGRLTDLLEIERELARVQSEIDSTESILAAMRLRVSMSDVTLSYSPKYSAVSQSIWRPLADAFDSFMPNVVSSLAGIVNFISSVALWLILIVIAVWLVMWRIGAGRRKTPAARTVVAAPGAPPQAPGAG